MKQLEKYHDIFFPSNGRCVPMVHTKYEGKQTKLTVKPLKDIISIGKKYVDNNINNLYPEHDCDHFKNKVDIVMFTMEIIKILNLPYNIYGVT